MTDSMFTLKYSLKYQYWLAIKLEEKNSGEALSLINLYNRLVSYSDKEEFWDSLIRLKEDQWHHDSIVEGDLNMNMFTSKN